MKKMSDLDKELVKLFGEDKFAKIINAKIGIAGCGGLGSNCAGFLVRSGFRDLKIVDFDNVESSNLNRQFYFKDQEGEKKVEALKANLEKINPSVKIEAITVKIEKENVEEIFSDRSIIVEAFDKAEYKSMIISELVEKKEMVVSVSGICGIGESDKIVTRRIKDNLVIIGDLVTDSEKNRPFAPKVAIAAAKQADIILEYVLSMGG